MKNKIIYKSHDIKFFTKNYFETNQVDFIKSINNFDLVKNTISSFSKGYYTGEHKEVSLDKCKNIYKWSEKYVGLQIILQYY